MLDDHDVLRLTHPEAVVDNMPEPKVFRHPHQAGPGPETAHVCGADLLIDLVQITGVITQHLTRH